jgi:hypothetical protein
VVEHLSAPPAGILSRWDETVTPRALRRRVRLVTADAPLHGVLRREESCTIDTSPIPIAISIPHWI